MNNKILSIMKYYKLSSKLKDTIRKGPKVWNCQRERIESVAEHIYGTQMLALAIYSQFSYKIDISRVLYMLAIHELEEIEIGDMAFYEITKTEKERRGKEVVNFILKDLLKKEEIETLINEYNNNETEEAKFAYHCDKLDCNIQMKLYDQEKCFDLNNQHNNPILNKQEVKSVLESENSISNAWIEFDRNKFIDDANFIEIINWLKENEI